MAWSGNSYPDGGKNLSDNRVGIAGNFEYTEDKLDLDHFWTDADADNNGRHQFVNMPTGAADATKERDGVVYVKTVGSEHDLHYRNASAVYPMTPGVLWGFAIFDPAAGVPTLTRSKNIASVSYAGGVFTFTFTTAAPSANYMVLGGVTNNSGSQVNVSVSDEDGSGVIAASFDVVLADTDGTILTGAGITPTKTYVMAVY